MARKTPEAVQEVMEWLGQHATEKDRDNLTRFGISAKNAVGVSMANMQLLAKKLGRDHALAEALWQTECYEARMLTAFVDEPERVTAAQMERWCRDFDNWAICDTLCFHLFDRTPHAWKKVDQWNGRKEEFVKRTAFALLACLALHNKESGNDGEFLKRLPLIESASIDERNFVKKGVSWALRSVGRRSAAVHAASVALAERLAGSQSASARWIGKDALRDLNKPAVKRSVSRKG